MSAWRPRWEHHLLASGPDFLKFWKDYLALPDRRLGYVLAEGFDQRMCLGVEALRDAGWKEGKALRFSMDYGPAEAKLMQEVAESVDELDKILGGSILSHRETLNMREDAHKGEGARQAFAGVRRFCATTDLTDIVIDVNAMPKSVALSSIASALRAADALSKQGRVLNVHAIVGHNPSLDDSYERLELQQDPFLLSGFLSDYDSEDPQSARFVWIPILGPGQHDQLKAIKAKYPPYEICPAVPSPSPDPRKGDELIVEYRGFLVEQREFLPRNVLRVSELDPFEAYAEIASTIHEYGRAYRLVEGCRVLISAHSSKLLSVAGLLAAYDCQASRLCDGVSMAFVEAQSHRKKSQVTTPTTLFTLWLAGDPYMDDQGSGGP